MRAQGSTKSTKQSIEQLIAAFERAIEAMEWGLLAGFYDERA